MTTSSVANQLQSEKTEMRRDVTLFGGISVLAGIMIGSGIFYIGAIVLQRAGMSPGLSLLVWLIGGLVTLLSGICFAELGAMIPKAGGYYVYLREAYGERIAFMCGFGNFCLSNPGSIAALAVAFAAALNSIWTIDPISQKVIAISTVLLLTLINIRGVGIGSRLGNVFMVLKMLPILLILFAGLLLGEESPDLFMYPGEMPSISTLLSMIGFAVIATLWAYEGWTNLNNIAEEIKNPKRNIPLALILAIVGVALLYVLFNYAIFRVVPYGKIVEMVNSGNYYLGTEAANMLFGSAGLYIVGAAMILAIFSSLNGCVLAFPRMTYAMANLQNKEYWTVDNPTNDYARIGAKGPVGAEGARMLYNRSFIRLDNISLGYTLPQEWTKRFQIERLKLFASIRNVAVWGMDGKLKYYGDPENLGTATRTYSLGLNMVF